MLSITGAIQGTYFYGSAASQNPSWNGNTNPGSLALKPVSGIGGVGGIEGKDGPERVGKGECQTCKNRKYVDGSDEGNVSFQAPGHISPQASGARVMSHEKEHVANARREGNEENKQLVSASVSLKMAVCPECGRSYVSGGETRTTIRTSYSSNPYDQARKTIEGSYLAGQKVDAYI